METVGNTSNGTVDFLNISFEEGSKPVIEELADFAEIRTTISKFSLALSLTSSLTIVIALVSILLTYIVLKALSLAKTKVLRSKYFIGNALVINTLFCIFESVGIVREVALVFESEEGELPLYCFRAFRVLAITLVIYSQCMSSFVLAFDRIYAIVYPLTYHLNGYSKSTTCFIILLGIYGVPVSLLLPPVVTPFIATEKAMYCPALLVELTVGSWSDQLRFYTMLGSGIMIFGLYIIMFILVKQQRFVSGSGETDKIVSLVLTYFFVHVSRFCLYLPAPILSTFRSSGFIKLQPKLFTALLKTVINIHLLNAIIDPFIFASRIRSIRENLPFSITVKRRGVSANEPHSTNKG